MRRGRILYRQTLTVRSAHAAPVLPMLLDFNICPLSIFQWKCVVAPKQEQQLRGHQGQEHAPTQESQSAAGIAGSHPERRDAAHALILRTDRVAELEQNLCGTPQSVQPRFLMRSVSVSTILPSDFCNNTIGSISFSFVPKQDAAPRTAIPRTTRPEEDPRRRRTASATPR